MLKMNEGKYTVTRFARDNKPVSDVRSHRAIASSFIIIFVASKASDSIFTLIHFQHDT